MKGAPYWCFDKCIWAMQPRITLSVMSTREKLLTIDETDFETLVLLYLRRHNRNLRGLIHTGVNAEGRPIKCPVDGVLHVIGPPSELVHVAATIHNPTEIHRKWLGGKKAKDKPEPGDIARHTRNLKVGPANPTQLVSCFSDGIVHWRTTQICIVTLRRAVSHSE